MQVDADRLALGLLTYCVLTTIARMANNTSISSPGRTRYGYRKLVDGALVEDEAEQDVCRLVLEMRERGYGYARIAQQLDGFGIAPRYAPTWSDMMVKRIVDRSAPRGAKSVEDVLSGPRCPWCKVAIEIGGTPTCSRCGHRSDIARYQCDCESCSRGTT